MSAVLGLKCGDGHDTGAALVWEQGGELRCVAISEERLSRIKHDNAFPARSIDACLAHAGLALHDVDLLCLDMLGAAPGLSTLDTRVMTDVPDDSLSAEELEFIERFGRSRAVLVNHHLAHAASAFAVTDMADAAVLVIDGSGTRFPLGAGDRGLIAMGAHDAPDDLAMAHYGRSAETQSVFRAERDAHGVPRYTRVATSRISGIGHFYTFFTRHVLGFGVGQEGKSMGLAGWGDSTRRSDWPVFPDACFEGIDTPLLDHLKDVGFRPEKRDASIEPTDAAYADIAAWMQDTLSRAVRSLARQAVASAESRNLCLAGGVALNVVANREVRDEMRAAGSLDRIFVQPASSDAGTPLGVALVGYSEVLGGSAPFQQNLVYLGPERSADDAEAELVEQGGELCGDVVARVADLLLDGKIVGWFQGRSEYGPRALGARSILCWPRPEWMKDHLNARVKHREMFRPFAPIIAEERAGEVFDCEFPVPYMLFNTLVRPEYRDRLPAVTHIDGSGRLQTVARERTPLLHELLAEIYRRDGVGVLLNTSFNDAGEPIVETAEDAWTCFSNTDVDALVVGRAVIVKDAVSSGGVAA